MLDKSLFVSTSVHEKQIELPDGSKITMYFKELPAIEIIRWSNAASSTDEETRSFAMIKLIALALCDSEGKPAATAEEISQLKPSVIPMISEAVLEVNGKGAEKKD